MKRLSWPGSRSWTVVALLAGLVLALYASFLSYAPPGLHQDEVFFGLHAQAIATSGRDLDGRLLPLYFLIRLNGLDLWFHPFLVYVTAPWLMVLPLSTTALRLPTALAASLDVVFVCVLARRMCGRTSIAIVAGALLALTPAHFMMGRLASNHLYLATFILGWLVCMLPAGELRPWRLFAAGVILGVGIYSYLGALLMMPVCLALTFAALAVYHRDRAMAGSAAAAIAFAALVVPLAVWLTRHPTAFGTLAGRYEVYQPDRTTAVEGIVALGRWSSVVQRAGVYLDYFHPRFLLVRGDVSPVHSTSKAGVFLIPTFVLALAGVYHVLRMRPIPKGWALVLALLLFAPLPGAFVAEAFRISRAAILLPCVALLAAAGVDALWQAGGRARTSAILLLALVPLQFGYFYRDYMGQYRLRVSHWLGANAPQAFDRLVEQAAAPGAVPIYLSDAIPFADYRWRLYVIERHREQLLTRTAVTTLEGVPALPREAIVLSNFDDATERALLADGFRRTAGIPDIDGAPSFAVLMRTR
jgi:dolichyl-phosphate-mannose-protein mannosyltransferase